MTPLLCLLLMLFTPPGLSADAQTGAAAQSGSTPGPQAASQPQVSEPTSEELITSTLVSDISTASYYELVTWCGQLGIEDSGSRADLQKKLYDHFSLTPPAEQKKAGRSISVKSAKDTEYFTVSEMNEKYIVLRGDVVVVLNDPETGSTQEIHAQRLTLNQSLNTITATGGVEYMIKSGTTTENFTGESLSFNLNTWEGVFYDGSTSRPQARGSQTVTFHFQGDTISRLENDTVIMDGGSITSSDISVAPNWQMRAGRVWLLAPGEWALENATLFVGAIPMLYLPYFFYPGDEIFFNPVLGFDNKTGAYLQTTTYLMGKKKPQPNSTLSFMQLSGGGNTDYDQELHGIFLRKIPLKAGTKQESAPTLKLELDGYSRLGVFLGLMGDFSPLASFQVGIAESRSLFQDPVTGVGYTPFFIDSNDEAVSIWNQSSVFGLMLPLRFGLKGDLSASAGIGSLSTHFEYYSDPYFTSDFYNRSEGMQLTNNLQTLLTPPPSQQASRQSILSWNVTSRGDFSSLIKLPFIRALSIPFLNFMFTWQSRDAASDPDVPSIVAKADPARTFFFPSNLVAPNISVSLSGDVFRYSSSQPPSAPVNPGGTGGPVPALSPQSPSTPTPDPGKGFHPPELPTPPKAPEKPAGQADHFTFQAPSRRQDVSVAAARQAESSASLSYQVLPRSTYQQTFDSSRWQKQQDVNFNLLYSTLESGGSTQLVGNYSILDNMIGGSLTLSADGTYRLRSIPTDSSAVPIQQSLIRGDLNQDQLNIRTIFQSSVRPFAAFTMLSDSNLSYRLNLLLARESYDPTSDPLQPVFLSSNLGSVLLPWNKAVSEHALQSALSLKAFDSTSTLSFTAQLPPLDSRNLTGQLNVAYWIFQTRLQTGATYSQAMGVWTYQPLIAGETANFTKDSSLSEELQYNLTTQLLDRSTSQLRLWGLTSSFIALNMVPVDHLLGTPIPGKSQTFLPSTFTIGYSYTSDTTYFWKNRIKLSGAVNTNWNQNLQKYTDNAFNFTLSLNLSIFQFLDLTFSSNSYNNLMYKYIPGWGGKNVFIDLLKSFDFFQFPIPQDRYDSNFKLRSLSIQAVHHLGDWDLSFQYQGSPQIVTNADGSRTNKWIDAFAILVQWVAVPELRGRAHQDTTGNLYFRD
jgi:lipopolysaccharide assembly outer membrane protein LptD (OstA)